MMAALEDSDEEYLDDPIQLLDFRKSTETVNNHNQETSQTIFELTDPEGDLYIEKNNVFQKTIPYNKVSITLPVSFFELPRNVQLLNRCKQLSIKVVNCEKHPWYHKQFLNSNASDNDEEVDFYTRKEFKDINDMQNQNDTMIERGKKIKIRPVSSPYENLKKDNLKNKLNRKETQLRQCVGAISNSQIDFKKNQGLIGMKITQTPDTFLKKATEKKTMLSDKTVEAEKIKKDKAVVQEKKEKERKNDKTLNKVASTSSVTNVTDDIDKVIKNDVIGIEKLQEIIIKDITIVDSHDKKMQDSKKVNSIENLNIATETYIQKAVDKITAVEPKVKKTNVNNSENDNIDNLTKNIIDKKIQDNTKAHLSNKLNIGSIAKTQEVKENVYQHKSSTASKSKVPEIKDKSNQNNVRIVGMNTVSTINSQKSKTVSNNANVVSKLDIVNNEHLQIFKDGKKSIKYKNTDLDQLVLVSREQLKEHLCLATIKKQHNPETTYSAKLQGLKLTVTKKDSANNINSIAKNSKMQKDTKEVIRAKDIDKKKKVQKKTNCDPAKSIENGSSSSTGPQTNSILNMKLIKPVKNKPKKCNADTKLIKPRNKSKKTGNSISGNSEFNHAQPKFSNVELLSKDNMTNNDSDIINNKCNNAQNSNEFNYSPSNSGVEKSSHLFEGTSAPVVGKKLSSSFYIHEYKKLTQSDLQHTSKQVKPETNPLIYKTVNENSRPALYQNNSKLESLLTSGNLRNDNLPENVPPKNCNNSNVSDKQDLTKDMKLNTSVTVNPSVPTPIQSVNENQDCVSTAQSHNVQNQSQRIPLNIPTGKRCPRIIKLSKLNPPVANKKTNIDIIPVAGFHLDAMDFTSQRNINNQRDLNNYRIPDRPIQTLVTTRDNMPKQKAFDLQQNQINSQILSNLYSAAQQVTHNSLIPNQNVQQLSIAHQMKQPIVSQTGNHFQAAESQYKTSHEILPPTCDIAMVNLTPVHNVQKLQHQNMPNIMCQPQQQRHIPTHTSLRNESHPGGDRLQIQSNMKTASCQNPCNPKIIVEEPPKAAMRQNIYTVTPRKEINKNSTPFDYGFTHHQKMSPYSQGFQQALSEYSEFSCQNYASVYDGSPNDMNQLQNYWGTFYKQPIQYNTINNNLSNPKSVAGTTIIGHDDSGPVRKININIEPLSKENNTTQQPYGQRNFDKDTMKSFKTYQRDSKTSLQCTDDKKGVSGYSPVAYSKKEMLEELTKITTIESSDISPVKDLKRPLPNTNPIKEIPNAKRYRPGPLSRKLKFDSMTSPQSNAIVAPVTHKGYSPPILPIPTYQKTLEILARSNITDPRLSHSISVDVRNTETLNAMCLTMNDKMQTAQNEKSYFDGNQDKSAKKISLDEYKKRTSIVEDKKSNESDMLKCNIKMEIKIENSEQDLGYDSDSTTKL